jgi:hypothetical protein
MRPIYMFGAPKRLTAFSVRITTIMNQKQWLNKSKLNMCELITTLQNHFILQI